MLLNLSQTFHHTASLCCHWSYATVPLEWRTTCNVHCQLWIQSSVSTHYGKRIWQTHSRILSSVNYWLDSIKQVTWLSHDSTVQEIMLERLPRSMVDDNGCQVIFTSCQFFCWWSLTSNFWESISPQFIIIYEGEHTRISGLRERVYYDGASTQNLVHK